MPMPDFETARRWYVNEQKSLSEICELVGLSRASRSRVSNLLKKGGVEIRPSRAEIGHQAWLEKQLAKQQQDAMRAALMAAEQEEEAEAAEREAERAAELAAEQPVEEPVQEEPPVPVVQEQEAEPPAEEEEPKRGRGRPKGAKTKPTPDGKLGVAKKGDNAKVLKHNLAINEWGTVDMFSKHDVKERVKKYFTLCISQDMSPTLPGLALAFGVSRFVFQRWVNGADVSPDVATELYRAVCLIDADAAQKLTKGMVHPKSGEFLMKNTLGYRDETTVVQEHVEKRPSVEAIKEKYAKLLGE